MSSRPRYDAVLFDLLTGLLDSWTLWDGIAGNEADGRRWRAAYLRHTYGTGAYRPYELVAAEAAEEVGLARGLADRLAALYGEVKPWPEAHAVLSALHEHVPLAVVTNCSEHLGALAAATIGVEFDALVTAERAGFYKPDTRPYRQALAELGFPPSRCLFVAGSAFDLFGTAKLGMPTYWHNRIGLAAPADAPRPFAQANSLWPLVEMVLGPCG